MPLFIADDAKKRVDVGSAVFPKRNLAHQGTQTWCTNKQGIITNFSGGDLIYLPWTEALKEIAVRMTYLSAGRASESICLLQQA